MSPKTAKLFTLTALILLVPLAAGPSAAQSRVVRGVVTDEANAPVPSAAVKLSCARTGRAPRVLSTTSKADGGFQFQTRLIGACKVSIAAPGFVPILISISSSDKSEPVDLGTLRLRISCEGPGVTCDQVTPAKTKP
jgi:hypothetical protein